MKGLVCVNNAAAGVDVDVAVGGECVKPDREQRWAPTNWEGLRMLDADMSEGILEEIKNGRNLGEDEPKRGRTRMGGGLSDLSDLGET